MPMRPPGVLTLKFGEILKQKGGSRENFTTWAGRKHVRPDLVGGGVVGVAAAEGDALRHGRKVLKKTDRTRGEGWGGDRRSEGRGRRERGATFSGPSWLASPSAFSLPSKSNEENIRNKSDKIA